MTASPFNSQELRLLDQLPGDLDRLHREDPYRFLTETISDVIWTIDLTLKIDYVSPPVTALLGYSPDEIRGMKLSDLLTDSSLELAQNAFDQYLEDSSEVGGGPERSCTLDLELRHNDGSRVWIEAKMSGLTGADGSACGILGVARDITSWRKSQEALQHSQARLHRAERNEAIGQMAGSVAHDFNNLLTVILGNVQLLLAGLPPDQPGRLHAEELLNAANQAAGLTRQLLTFSQRQASVPKLVDLNRIVLEMEPMLRRLIGESIDLRVRLDRDVGLVLADPSQIEQVVMNLVVNARDAMPHGGHVTIETLSRPIARSLTQGRVASGEQDFAMLAVTDIGCGIEPDHLSRIFEPFFSTKQSKGTGLGLATVSGVIELCEGHLWVASEPSEGARFEVYLPVAGDRGSGSRQDGPTTRPQSREESVLVVEDEDGVRNLVRRVLEDDGYRVVFASSADQAKEVFRSQGRIDLLVTDIVMPGENGYHLARDLGSRQPDLKMLFISGHPDDVLVEHGRLEGPEGFLAKPFSPGDLSAKVREILDAGKAAPRIVANSV